MRVIERPGDYGLFRAGAVLIGTEAFFSAANMFGVEIVKAPQGDRIELLLRSDFRIDARSPLRPWGRGTCL